MIRVIYDIDTYDGYAASKTDSEIFVYDENWNVLHHITGIYGAEWDYISIEGGEWTEPSDIPVSENSPDEKIEKLLQQIALLQEQLADIEDQTDEIERLQGVETELNNEIVQLQREIEILRNLSPGEGETQYIIEQDKLVGYISGESSLTGWISAEAEPDIETVPVLVGYLSIPEHIGTKYDGSYEVVPTTGFQLMDTEEKYMEENVIVHPIPYAEVSNESGGYTATIGG